LLDVNIDDFIELDTGYYRVLFSLQKPGHELTTQREILHIYPNMTSFFEFEFTDDHFNLNIPQTGSAGITLSFEQIANQAPVLTNPIVISQAGTPTSTPPSSITISVDSPDQYSEIEWFLDNAPLNTSGLHQPSVTINAAALDVRDYYLTVEVVRGGIPYSRTITLEVRN
jgi:hypothetical protein